MKSNYSAKIIAHSISPDGIELLTYEIEYPRFIHSELMTHRMLPKNAASSRAIPIETMHKHIMDNTAQPIYWGRNQKGMSASEEVDDIPGSIKIWMRARNYALACARRLNKKDVHKQTANRIVEPYVIMKTVISGTCWENFFHLRDHKDAQPEFRYLAQLMKKPKDDSTPILLKHGEWHLPYVESVRNEFGKLIYLDLEGNELSLEDARIVSAACCAQVSYRKLNESVALCKSIFSRLVESDPAHASPVEHQATPIDLQANKDMDGITHMTRDGMLWSGPYKGWVQFRKLIPNDAVW